MSDADKPALRSANDNPWYCLATLHGEQPVDFLDDELASKNRLAWNRWVATALSDKKRASLVGFTAYELAALGPEEKIAFCRDYAVRTGRESELPPDPTERYDFTFTHFDRPIEFAGFLFDQTADFSSATFSVGTDFSSATFSGAAEFSSATFSGAAEFSSARFSGIAGFSSARFSGIAGFSSARFSGIAGFRSATFSGHADFNSATFSGDADFNSATFSGVTFLDAKFAAKTIFARSDFGDQVPDFRGATMHEATEWHGAIWPKPPKDRVGAQAQVYAYERLKLEMERLKKHEDELSFFRRELRARRGLARPLSGGWFLNFGYQVSSNYGQSIALPLFWLFVLFATGCAVFYAMHATMAGPAVLSFEGIPHAAALSFGNIFPFVPIIQEIIKANPVTSWSRPEKIIGVAQSLLGTPLLFLFGLALRNRFRMK